MPLYRIGPAVGLAFVAGTTLTALCPQGVLVSQIVCIAIACGTLPFLFPRRTRGIGLLLLLVACSAVIGLQNGLRLHAPLPPTAVVRYATGSTITLTGRIAGLPSDRGWSMQYVVDALEKDGVRLQGSALVTSRDLWPLFSPGDRVQLSGIMQDPFLETDGGYARFLRSRGIGALLENATLQRVPGPPPTIALRMVALRGIVERRIIRLLPEPHAALLTGLLTGERRGMSDAFAAALRITGLTHIVAVSGSNITLVLIAVDHLLFFLPRRWRLLPAAGGVILFTLFTGAEAPVVRAAVMGIIGLLAVHGGRLPDTRRALLASAVLLLAWKPSLLLDDVGFQLSFLAVLGIVEWSPILLRLLRRVPKALGMREALCTTLAAQCLTAPWSAAQFGTIPLLGVIANIIVAPFIPLAMLCGTVAVVLDVLLPPLAAFAAYGAWAALNGIVQTTLFFAKAPGTAVAVQPSPAMALGISGGVFVLARVLQRMAVRPTTHTPAHADPNPHAPRVLPSAPSLET